MPDTPTTTAAELKNSEVVLKPGQEIVDLVEVTIEPPEFNAEAVIAGFEARRDKLKGDITAHTEIRARAQRLINAAREELKQVERIIGAAKPKTRGPRKPKAGM